VVKELIIRNATIDSEDCKRRTPLSYGIFFYYLISLNLKHIFLLKASENGNIDVVKELLKLRANIDSIDESERSPLHLGIYFNYLSNLCILELFFAASKNGKIEVVKELLKHNVNIDLKDNFGRTPLHMGIIF
jgi:ankyrin repeat protein